MRRARRESHTPDTRSRTRTPAADQSSPSLPDPWQPHALSAAGHGRISPARTPYTHHALPTDQSTRPAAGSKRSRARGWAGRRSESSRRTTPAAPRIRPVAGKRDRVTEKDGLLGGLRSTGEDTSNEAVLPRARALMSDLPGRLTQISCDTGGGGRWLLHVGDVEFLEAWLRRPDFHSIK
ncbi:DUF6368 family protein [Streptomyces vinaceus]|uniref:DUF6368 family protein n=1 Tax=Streptomyces vinaceus TaxID=1960 RepID=UPI0035D84195